MNFRGFLLILVVFLSVLRICHVEDPEVGTGSKPSLSGQNDSLNVEEANEVKSNGELSDSSSSSSSSYTTSSPSSSFSSLSSSSSSSTETSTDSLSTFSSKRSFSSSELEQLVTPTVAPATPHFDTETITSSSSVIVSVTESRHQEKMPVEEPAPQQEFLLASGIKPEGIETCKSEEKGKDAEIHESRGSEEKLFQDETVSEKPQEEQSVVTPLPTPEDLPDKKDADSSASLFNDKKEEEPKDIKKDTKDKDEKEETQSKEDEPKDREDDSITAELKQAEEETKPTSEEMPSFDEFKRQHLQEEEKQKNILKQQKEVKGTGPETVNKPKPRKIKQRKQNNYASLDCGAKILKANPEASNIFAILQDNRDLYMLNPCSANIWFIVELCDNVQVKTIEIANFELFSSTPESFKVYVSGRYPTREWTLLGTFQARHERNLQSFPLDEPIYAKYIKVEMLTHFGSEHYCPLTLFRVFGISMMEELEDHEADGQDDADVGDEDDGAQVLPSDPSVKNDENKPKSNILATVGDTLFNIVKVAAKKLTGAIDNEKNFTGDSHGTSTVAPPSSIVPSTTLKEQGDKPSIVTFIPSDDEDDKIQDTKQNNKTTNGTSSTEPTKPEQENERDNTNFYDKIDPDSSRGSKTASAFSSCELFVRMLGHSSFGCMMGKVLYSKRKHHGFTPREESPAKQKTSARSVKAPPGSDGRTEANTDKGKEDSKKNEENKEGEKESEKVEEKGKKKGKEKFEEKVNEPIVQKEGDGNEIIPKDEDEIKQKETSVETKGYSDLNAEKVSKENEQKIINGVVDPVIIVQPSEVQPPIIKPCDASAEKKATPVLKTASLLTTHPSDDIIESQCTQTTGSDIEPTLKTLEKSNEEASESLNRATIDDASKITPDAKDGVSISENTGKESIDTKSTENIISKKEETATEEGSSASSIVDQSSGVKDTCTSVDSLDKSIIKPSHPPPSECKAPSIETHNKDVDVLEFKILDSAGREGTAHLEKPTDTPVKPDKPVPEPDKPVLEKKPIEDTKEEKPDATSQSSSEPSAQNTSDVSRASPTKDLTLSSSSVEPTKPSVVIPDSPSEPPINPPDVKPTDSPESISPLSPPPVDKPPMPPPQSGIEASISDDLSSVLSKATSSATPGAQGLASSGAQKESIFMRLTNRIKALEQNLTLSTLYMEKLNQKYRKIVEDMQKNLDKKVNLLTNATRKAEAVIKSQKEQISALQSKVDDTSRDMKKFSKQLKSLNIQVMERHIIGLFLEVILIMILFIVFRRWDRARIRRDILRESRMNGTILTSHNHFDHTEDRALGKILNGQLSGREQLQRSFLNPSKPEIIGALSESVACRHKEELFPLMDAKKKRNRKRPKSGVITTETNQAKTVSESTNQTTPSSLVSATAGLLFNPTRGLMNGLKRSRSLDDSQSNRKSSLPSTSRLQKTKSMNVIQENTDKNSFSMGNSKKGRVMNR